MELGTVSVFVIFSMLLLGPVTVSQFAFASGDDTPDNGECDNADFKNEKVDLDTSDMQSAGAGFKISGLCIKDGSGAFTAGTCPSGASVGSQHSCLITASGTFNVGANACYQVMGIGTQTATVTENAGCTMDLSHVEYFIMVDDNGTPPGGFNPVGGEFIGIDTTAVLVAGAQNTAAWMIPVIIAAAGLGIVIARKF